MSKLIYPINLQLFADGIAPEVEAQAPAPTPSVGQSAPVSLEQKLGDMWEKANVPEPTAPQSPAIDTPVEPPVQDPVTQPVPEETPSPEQSLPENFKSVGEVVRSFKNAQAELTRKSQMVADLTKSNETMKAEFEAKLQALAQPQQPQAAPVQPEDEFAGLDAEGMLEKFYADPTGVVGKLVEKIVDSRVKPLEGKLNPIMERNEYQQNLDIWNEAITGFNTSNPDMPEFLDGMKQYIAENNLQGSKEPQKVLKNAYTYAKGLKYAPPTDPATLLNDENFVKQVTANPSIREAIIKEHLASVRGTQNSIPPSISGNSSSNAPAMPPLKATSIREATERAAARIFGG